MADREAMLLRLPPELKEQVRERAVAAKRSLTRQIEFELEQHNVTPAGRASAEIAATCRLQHE